VQDLLVFNPPYVPTSSAELGGAGIARSWAGGVRGREVLDRLLESVDDLLSPTGLLYLVVIKENDPEDVQRRLSERGMDSEAVARRRAGKEELRILKAWRKQTSPAPPFTVSAPRATSHRNESA
jgi:release factor glutamine methyltransferase